MANEVIQLDANELAQKIIDKMATDTVGTLIHRVLQTQLPKEEDLRRNFDYAVNEVTREYFLNHLRNDPQFAAKLKKHVEEHLSAEMVKKAISTLGEKITRGY